jgi:KTSC domain
LTSRKRLPLIVGVLVLAWIVVLLSKTTRLAHHSPARPPSTEAPNAGASPHRGEPPFASYGAAVEYVRSHYAGESFDTGRSSWITSAEYFPAEGRGYLILGMRGRPYIFAGVPAPVWQGFKEAPSLGRYYNENIRGRYRLDLGER